MGTGTCVQKEIKKALDNDYIEEDFSGEGIERHNIKVVDGRINSYDIKEKFCEFEAELLYLG